MPRHRQAHCKARWHWGREESPPPSPPGETSTLPGVCWGWQWAEHQACWGWGLGMVITTRQKKRAGRHYPGGRHYPAILNYPLILPANGGRSAPPKPAQLQFQGLHPSPQPHTGGVGGGVMGRRGRGWGCCCSSQHTQVWNCRMSVHHAHVMCAKFKVPAHKAICLAQAGGRTAGMALTQIKPGVIKG